MGRVLMTTKIEAASTAGPGDISGRWQDEEIGTTAAGSAPSSSSTLAVNAFRRRWQLHGDAGGGEAAEDAPLWRRRARRPHVQ